MSNRFCPECDTRTHAKVCPKCGTRTIEERRKDDRPDPLVGQLLDERYRIESVIGRGGMGSVYRGIQIATNQVVAIKVMKTEYAEDIHAVKRFHREVRAASLLTHPHTIRVFDFGQTESGELFMVLEHLTGRTLSRALKVEGLFSEQRIAKIAGQVCQSLAEAHAKGLVHRDLKPENIMLVNTVGDPDFVKVLDFGIVKVVSGSSAESSVTKAGVVVGTPQYMSPEQALGLRNLTPAVDIYSLGIVIYQGLTGLKPFDGDSAMSILMSHIHQPVPELPSDCAVTQEMRSVLRRMLAKDPEARPKAVELVATFERLKNPVRGVSRPVPSFVDDSPKAPPAPGPFAATEAADKVQPRAAVTPSEESDRTLRIEITEPSRVVEQRGSRRRFWMIPAAVTLLAFGIGYLAMPGNRAGGESATKSGNDTVVVPADSGPRILEPPEVPSAMSDERSAPDETHSATARLEVPSLPRETLRLRFDSSPQGASVHTGGIELGKTPFEAEIPGPPGRRYFTFTLKGFEETTVIEEVRNGSVVTVQLKQTKVLKPRPKTPGVSAPVNRKRFVPVDD